MRKRRNGARRGPGATPAQHQGRGCRTGRNLGHSARAALDLDARDAENLDDERRAMPEEGHAIHVLHALLPARTLEGRRRVQVRNKPRVRREQAGSVCREVGRGREDAGDGNRPHALALWPFLDLEVDGTIDGYLEAQGPVVGAHERQVQHACHRMRPLLSVLPVDGDGARGNPR